MLNNAVFILILIFPLLGISAKKPIDISIELGSNSDRETGDNTFHYFYYYQNLFADNWYDFYQDDKTGEYHLHKANITVEKYYCDCRQDYASGYSSERPSLLLIRGLKTKKKPVKTLVLPIENITLEENHSFRFDKKTYTFRAEGTVRTDGHHDEYWYKVKDYKLYLSDGKNEQLMTTVEYFDGTSPDIVWVGDMDGDGKPDFVLRTATWYENERLELYLSSIAGKGELFKLAGTAGYFRDC